MFWTRTLEQHGKLNAFKYSARSKGLNQIYTFKKEQKKIFFRTKAKTYLNLFSL